MPHPIVDACSCRIRRRDRIEHRDCERALPDAARCRCWRGRQRRETARAARRIGTVADPLPGGGWCLRVTDRARHMRARVGASHRGGPAPARARAGNVDAGSARASAIRGGRGTAPGRRLAVCRAAPSGGGRPGGQAAGDLHGLGNSGHRPVADRVGQQRTGLRWQVPSANRRVTPSHRLRRSTGPGERSGLRSQAPPKPRSEAAPTRDASGCWTAW